VGAAELLLALPTLANPQSRHSIEGYIALVGSLRIIYWICWDRPPIVGELANGEEKAQEAKGTGAAGRPKKTYRYYQKT
jgi:hypothetical protein